MSTDAWRTAWHPLGGKTSWRASLNLFFSLLWSLNCQSKRTGPQKKRAVGLSFFVVVKERTVLQVFIARYIMPCLERKHLWWSWLINSWRCPKANHKKIKSLWQTLLFCTIQSPKNKVNVHWITLKALSFNWEAYNLSYNTSNNLKQSLFKELI